MMITKKKKTLKSMDTIWCDKIVTVNRAVPVWTNVFLLIPSVLALTQTNQPMLVRFGVLGVIVSVVSALHHVYQMKPKSLCKSQRLPITTKVARSFQIIDCIFASVWGMAAVYLIVRAPAAPALKTSAVAMLVRGATMFGLARYHMRKAAKEDRNSSSERAAVLANNMKYDLYHGFWHATMGTVVFLAIVLHMTLG